MIMKKAAAFLTAAGIAISSMFTVPVMALVVEPVSVKLPVTVEGAAATVSIVPMAESSPMPASAEISVPANGSSEYEIEYVIPGTWKYEISQKPGNEEGWEYDDTIYECTVFIESLEENGALHPIVTMYPKGSREKTNSAEFRNKKPEKPTVTPTPSNPSNPTPSTPSTPSVKDVKTGDNSPIMALVTVMGAAMLAIIIAAISIRKRKEA